MELSKRCAGEFSAQDWRHGLQYCRQGAVLIRKTWATGFAAEVQGSAPEPYDVQIDWSKVRKGSIAAYCSCPRFDDVGLCKHVAAALQEADSRRLGRAIPGTQALQIESDYYASEFSDEGSVSTTDSDWEEYVEEIRRTIGTSAGAATKKSGARKTRARAKRPPAPPAWVTQLDQLDARPTDDRPAGSTVSRSKPREIWYLVDIGRTMGRGWLHLKLWQRPIKKNGEPGKLKPVRLTGREIEELASDEDRALLGMLVGNERHDGYGYYSNYSSYQSYGEFAITPAMHEVLVPRLAASGRFGWCDEDFPEDEVRLLTWDDGPAWKLRLHVDKTADRKHWQLSGRLERNGDIEALSAPLVLMALGLVVFPDRIARFDAGADFRWVALMRNNGPILVPVKAQQDLMERLSSLTSPGEINLPDELRWEETPVVPLPQLRIARSNLQWETNLQCSLSFQYGDKSAPLDGGPGAWYDRETQRSVRRDLPAEHAARDQLLAAGAQPYGYHSGRQPGVFSIAPKKVPRLVTQLAAAGWQVEAEGRVIRRPGAISINLTSDNDWFDLEGACDFGGVSASLPKLLEALRRGEQYVALDDGSQGMLPQEWLARYAGLAELGQAEGDRLRFLPTQAALLDALLAAQEANCVRVDRTFEEYREKLRAFEGVQPRNEPNTFVGELRHYQREGLGWLHFLDDFSFGGCLADDMGLGKTIQILALLEERRAEGSPGEKRPGPSLVVAPRSLIFNWIEEARRFTPGLRVLNYTGLERSTALERLNEYDLVVTTYGTVRRDVARLTECRFDYAILDEAQAIKNASSQAAKACRLLNARRRLAMTGTPVENHLGELWSLFDFLNPGMLGRNQKLNELASNGRRAAGSNGSSQSNGEPAGGLSVLARALRPFLLRRTKRQVLTELPDKTEQTLYCELDETQRKLYDELRDFYRNSLLDRVGKVGVNKSKIQVLEALLRLRQAACHPGLLDKKRSTEGSAKFETLLEQLDEVLAEGHKALVFSQFTSLLAILRKELDRRKIVYEYLDGKTTNRQSKVERFQSDPACPLFLISLKAGGQGLNLTAADYVFILDPWWNPAVEAQAVDRAHRMGQQRHVFAYRLIARDTVEEKILQLQDRKRGLAEAIVSADNSVLRNLTAEDLQLLLS